MYVHALVTCRFYFANALFYDLSKSSLFRLQNVQNTDAKDLSLALASFFHHSRPL